MGCGLISQRSAGAAGASASSSASTVATHRQNRGSQSRNNPHHNLSAVSLESGRGAAGAGGVRAGAADEDAEADAVHRISSEHGDSTGGPSGTRASEERASRQHRAEEGAPTSRGIQAPGRRFIVGERVVLTSRLPGNVQDHAFCFECGACFQLGSSRTPQCSRCGGSFVQYLRSSNAENWITADSGVGRDYSFDDQLDNSITASLDETPMQKKPTQAAFLRGLPSLYLTEEEVQTRSKLEPADPRYACAICRDKFAVEETLRRLPCSHEFHDGCIVPWLQNNNTCPICRCKMPEAADDEENDDDEVVGRKKRNQRRDAGEGAAEENGTRTNADRPVVGIGGREEATAFLEQHDVVASEGLIAGAPPSRPPASSAGAP